MDNSHQKSLDESSSYKKFDDDAQVNLPDPTFQDLEYRDWNSEFQQLLDNILQNVGDFAENYVKLSQLVNDFVEAAKTYSQIFVSEYRLKQQSKSIKYENVGGEAGGPKFKCNNIMFKGRVLVQNVCFTFFVAQTHQKITVSFYLGLVCSRQHRTLWRRSQCIESRRQRTSLF
jgi:hypothetical protein